MFVKNSETSMGCPLNMPESQQILEDQTSYVLTSQHHRLAGYQPLVSPINRKAIIPIVQGKVTSTVM
jgi:hypothetical protein